MTIDYEVDGVMLVSDARYCVVMMVMPWHRRSGSIEESARHCTTVQRWMHLECRRVVQYPILTDNCLMSSFRICRLTTWTNREVPPMNVNSVHSRNSYLSCCQIVMWADACGKSSGGSRCGARIFVHTKLGLFLLFCSLVCLSNSQTSSYFGGGSCFNQSDTTCIYRYGTVLYRASQILCLSFPANCLSSTPLNLRRLVHHVQICRPPLACVDGNLQWCIFTMGHFWRRWASERTTGCVKLLEIYWVSIFVRAVQYQRSRRLHRVTRAQYSMFVRPSEWPKCNRETPNAKVQHPIVGGIPPIVRWWILRSFSETKHTEKTLQPQFLSLSQFTVSDWAVPVPIPSIVVQYPTAHLLHVVQQTPTRALTLTNNCIGLDVDGSTAWVQMRKHAAIL